MQVDDGEGRAKRDEIGQGEEGEQLMFLNPGFHVPFRREGLACAVIIIQLFKTKTPLSAGEFSLSKWIVRQFSVDSKDAD